MCCWVDEGKALQGRQGYLGLNLKNIYFNLPSNQLTRKAELFGGGDGRTYPPPDILRLKPSFRLVAVSPLY